MQERAPQLADLVSQFRQAEVQAAWDDMIGLGERILQVDAHHQPTQSKTAQAYILRGNSYANTREDDQAIADYTRAIDLDPKAAYPYIQRGNSYHNKGEADQAIADYTRAIDLDPKAAQAYIFRGLVYNQRKEHQAARRDFQQAADLGNAEAKQELAHGRGATPQPELTMQPLQRQRRLRVFLCHAAGDKPLVRTLYHRLRADRFEPWLDEEARLAGPNWDYEIRRAVRASDVILVCLSRGSVPNAGHLHKELKDVLAVADEQAEGTNVLIPLRLDACAVPDQLRRWQGVDWFEKRGYERLRQALWARAATLGILRP